MKETLQEFLSRLGTRHAAALLFVAVFGVYLNSLGNGLVNFDDLATVSANESSGPPPCLGEFRMIWDANPARALQILSVSRPLRDLSLCADRALLGNSVWAHHLSNVAHHWGASVAAFLAARLLLGSAPLALLAALLFALHPLQTESVAYLGGRRDVLFGGLYLLAFWLGASALQRRSRALAAAAAAAWLLSLAAKQAAVTLPFTLALWYFLEGRKAGGSAPRWAGRAAAAGLLAAAAYALHAVRLLAGFARENGAAGTFYGGSALAQYLTVPAVAARAVLKVFFPASLHGDYSYKVITPPASPLDPAFLAACALLAALAWLAFRLYRRSGSSAFPPAFAAAAFAPMLPLMPDPHNLEVFAEHWLYLPLFGFALWAAGALARLPRAPAAALGAALLLFYAGRTAARNPDWKDAMTFWTATYAAAPDCGRAAGALGAEYFALGDYARAGELFRKAAEIRPDSPVARINSAALLERAGDYRGAERELKLALRTRGVRQSLPYLQYSLARLYLLQGRNREAERHALWSLQLRPAVPRPQTLDLLAWLRSTRGDYAGAEELLRRSVRLYPSYQPAHYSLAQLRYAEGDFRGASAMLEEALRLEPDHAPALALAASCAAMEGAYAKAAALVSRALYLAPRSPDSLTAAALLYRRQGRFRAALPYALRAATAGPRDAGAQLEAALALLETGRLREAEGRFLAALRLSPGAPQLRLHYADLLWITGRAAAAQAEVAALLRDYPGWPPALQARDLMRAQAGR